MFAEHKNVQHAIVKSLDSSDPVEQQAAIFAAERVAAQSKSFALSISPKLVDVIERLSTPFDTKLRLLPVFQHMHHDVETIEQVTEFFAITLLFT